MWGLGLIIKLRAGYVNVASLILFCFLFCNFAYSQNRLYVFESQKKTPINDLLISFNKYKSPHKEIFKTNEEGYIDFGEKFNDSVFIKIEDINYEYKTVFFNKINIDTVFLTEKTNVIDQVVVTSKEKLTFKRAIVGFLFNYKINLNHNDKLAQLIVKKKKERKIKKIKLKIIDGFGVRNLKFLPFKVSIYSKDSLILKPKECLFTSDVIIKSDNKKWVKVDISNLNFLSNKEDLFIVFEILKEDEYQQDLVNSKIGLIPAVPMLKAKIYNPKSSKKCYLLKYFTNSKFSEWEFIKCHLYVDFEYK